VTPKIVSTGRGHVVEQRHLGGAHGSDRKAIGKLGGGFHQEQF
jgi:hypothetical protein